MLKHTAPKTEMEAAVLGVDAATPLLSQGCRRLCPPGQLSPQGHQQPHVATAAQLAPATLQPAGTDSA